MSQKARSADGFRVLDLKLIVLYGVRLIRVMDGPFYIGDVKVTDVDPLEVGKNLAEYVDLDTLEGINSEPAVFMGSELME